MVGVADFEATFTDAEETDYFGLVAVLVLVVGLVGYGKGDTDDGFVGGGGNGQWGLLVGNWLQEPNDK